MSEYVSEPASEWVCKQKTLHTLFYQQTLWKKLNLSFLPSWAISLSHAHSQTKEGEQHQIKNTPNKPQSDTAPAGDKSFARSLFFFFFLQSPNFGVKLVFTTKEKKWESAQQKCQRQWQKQRATARRTFNFQVRPPSPPKKATFHTASFLVGSPGNDGCQQRGRNNKILLRTKVLAININFIQCWWEGVREGWNCPFFGGKWLAFC